MSKSKRVAIAFFFVMMPFLLGCEWFFALVSSPVSSSIPRWACPTPTPRPYGNDGPVKERRDGEIDPTTGIPEQEEVYYDVWEQEYGHLGDPAPAPTPYTKSGTVFFLDQIVNLDNGRVDAQLSVESTGIVTGTDELYLVHITWENRGDAFPFIAGRQVAISEILLPQGRKVANTWISSDVAVSLASETSSILIRQDIPEGSSKLSIPIIAPHGVVQTAELRLDLGETAEDLRVRFIAAQENDCGHPGTIAASYSDEYVEVAPPAIPEGTDDLVAFALKQVGRPYCWGGKGFAECDGFGWGPKKVTPSCPEQGGYPCWDCSGLTWGAYNAIGVVIGHGTSNQARYAEVSASQIQPGDLMLFSSINAQGRGATITHVGLYAGDVTGDGTGDMIHAANYPDGVVVTNNVLGNTYYRNHLVIITRPPRA